MRSARHQPESNQVLLRVLARGGLEPGDAGRVRVAIYQHPSALRDFLAGFIDWADPEERDLAVALMLTALRVRQGALDRPKPWPLALLLAVLTAPPEPERAADGRPADDLTPAQPVLIARTILTAAPPTSRAPVLAGAAA